MSNTEKEFYCDAVENAETGEKCSTQCVFCELKEFGKIKNEK